MQAAYLGNEVAQIACGGVNTCATKTDGTLWCWGNGILVPTQVEELGTNVEFVAVGMDHSCAVTTDDSLWCWGKNLYGQVGDGTTTTQYAPVQVSLPASDD